MQEGDIFYRFAFDPENDSVDFWDGNGRKVYDLSIAIAEETGFVGDTLYDYKNIVKEIFVPEKIGVKLLSLFESCDGWFSPDSPSYAKYPLVVEKVLIKELKELKGEIDGLQESN